MPKTPPTSRLVFVMAEPRPARWGPTEFITAAVMGAMVAPMPWPMMVKIGNMAQYDVSAEMLESASRPPPASSRPYVIGARDPCLDANRPARGAVTTIISVMGRNRTPASKAV